MKPSEKEIGSSENWRLAKMRSELETINYLPPIPYQPKKCKRSVGEDEPVVTGQECVAHRGLCAYPSTSKPTRQGRVPCRRPTHRHRRSATQSSFARRRRYGLIIFVDFCITNFVGI